MKPVCVRPGHGLQHTQKLSTRHSLRLGRLQGGRGLSSRPEHIDLLLQHLGHVIILAFHCTLLTSLQLGNLQVQAAIRVTSLG